MKQPRFVTSLKLSKLCRLLATAVCIKCIVLAVLAIDITGWHIPFISQAPIAVSSSVLEANSNPTQQITPIRQQKEKIAPLLPVAQAHAEEPPVPATAPEDKLTREALQQKQQELNRKEQDLTRLQQEIDQKLERLQALEQRLDKMLKDAKDTKDKKMRHLVDVYSNMKAKQAAQVLETLDEKIAVKILSGMRGRQAGEVLTFVKPDKAARLSEALTKLQLPFE